MDRAKVLADLTAAVVTQTKMDVAKAADNEEQHLADARLTSATNSARTFASRLKAAELRRDQFVRKQVKTLMNSLRSELAQAKTQGGSPRRPPAQVQCDIDNLQEQYDSLMDHIYTKSLDKVDGQIEIAKSRRVMQDGHGAASPAEGVAVANADADATATAAAVTETPDVSKLQAERQKLTRLRASRRSKRAKRNKVKAPDPVPEEGQVVAAMQDAPKVSYVRIRTRPHHHRRDAWQRASLAC